MQFLLKLPWTIVAEEGDEPGDLVLSIAEVPAAIGVGRSAADVEADLYAALDAVIRVYLEAGERPLRPTRMQAPLPWESHSSSPLAVRFRAVMESGAVRTV